MGKASELQKRRVGCRARWGSRAGRNPAQVALAWLLLNDSVTATLIGARMLSQLEDNLGALELELPDDACARIEQASAVALGFPHEVPSQPSTMATVFGDTKVSATH